MLEPARYQYDTWMSICVNKVYAIHLVGHELWISCSLLMSMFHTSTKNGNALVRVHLDVGELAYATQRGDTPVSTNDEWWCRIACVCWSSATLGMWGGWSGIRIYWREGWWFRWMSYCYPWLVRAIKHHTRVGMVSVPSINIVTRQIWWSQKHCDQTNVTVT